MKTTVTVINLDQHNPSYRIEEHHEIEGIINTYTANVVKLNGVEINTGQSVSVKQVKWAITVKQISQSIIDIQTTSRKEPVSQSKSPADS